ncbi:MAG: hypothetical protein K9J12_15000 [Melioribacteraceae bacterium]|nr:hypothetical protein [Melioribacteraceae bacterium]MCF8413444.1 hypothetical protein [Melioribacteraceae bacterium]
MNTGMKLVFKLIAITAITLLNINAQIIGTKMGAFENFNDVGAPSIPGKASYNEPDQTYHLSGSGANIWFGKDSFTFLSKKMNGDFIVQSQVQFVGEGHELHRKTGIMFRSSMDSSSAMISCTVHGDGLTALQFRRNYGEDIEEIKFELNGPDVLQLERKGSSIIMSVAQFGNEYVTEKIENFDIGEELYAGLFICSHNDNFSEEVVFSNTRIFNIAPETLVQYQEYLGSNLEVMEVESGHRRIVGSSTGSWQAPNWTPDGRTLIYNHDGLLYNFDLETGVSSVLNTDFADRNNNDHVLTFDGKQIAISHHSADDDGKSIIYTLPVEGGVPKRITDFGPSYLHGWSPDNKFLIYTAERDGAYNIFRISVDGGEEEQLTDTKGLDDGSEYSPDGKYIYFNSTRTGTMQVWRMDADGGNQTQLTFDELNDWFPHVSPDNKWLVFVSFPKEVPADSHPFYERVYIRLMPIEGGEVKVIGYLYGGQGTINVPSWSPDGKKIAFVSNGYFE